MDFRVAEQRPVANSEVEKLAENLALVSRWHSHFSYNYAFQITESR